jgi:hypothetical protein|uniref:mRNA cap 0 methyltransferase domain-containing protein n=1 Tax=viral metagenome TaxID=1070528 RepID=A0A6C0IKM1_9ZZZZ
MDLSKLPSDLYSVYENLSSKAKNKIKDFNFNDMKWFLKEYAQEKQLKKDKKAKEKEAKEKEDEEKRFRDDKDETDFDKLIKLYYQSVNFNSSSIVTPELEVKFGTKGNKPLNRNNYDDVIKKLKSNGFRYLDNKTSYFLRIQSEYTNKSGFKRMSSNRIEINDLKAIQMYCKTNNLKQLYENDPTSLLFIEKSLYSVDKKRVFPVNVNDFNFRVSYNLEKKIDTRIIMSILNNWEENKKTFRYINRCSFVNDDYPFIIDISIVKSSSKDINTRQYNPVYNIEDSNVFNNRENYEIEIEIDNNKINSPKYNSHKKIMVALRETVKLVLSGIQGTNYPVSYKEQETIQKEYLKMIFEKEAENMKIGRTNFIGPNSVTLQLHNVGQIDDEYETNEINIRNNFVVTEKADGLRHLMFINNQGRIYLISQGMNIKFTGSITKNSNAFNTIFDGELVLHDKNNNFINYYLVFDIYFINNYDLRGNKFMVYQDEKGHDESRYYLLRKLISELDDVSVVDGLVSPIFISYKTFYPDNEETNNIFDGCRTILGYEKDGIYPYTIDGLIFTHSHYGVGSNKIGVAGPKENITWNYSFKWKPPEFNTIDFMVSVVKESGEQDIHTSIQDGKNMSGTSDVIEYSTIILRTGFNEDVDGYINPCQDVIDDKIAEEFEKKGGKTLPYQFYPTEPFDINAGVTNIVLKRNSNNEAIMKTHENTVFYDNDIVEFSYDTSREPGFRWIPLRVRYDKKFPNKYETANSNWKSIHFPVTENILINNSDIPSLSLSDDKYYNTSGNTRDYYTTNLKDFHNLVIKKALINSVSNKGNTLIDFACGKAGDLPKWIDSKLSFVFGIDKSKDNIENRLNGACARYLGKKKKNNNILNALFINGDSGFNLRNGQGIESVKEKHIANVVFGEGKEMVGPGVEKNYKIGENGFNISSCQFALHYFFRDPNILQGFLTNVAECTKMNGYFIGTAYDGKKIFNMLSDKNINESIKIMENDKKIWEIVKEYDSFSFQDDSSSIGYKITVFQESINQYISEYLINFNYLVRLMEQYGFKLLEDNETQELGLPSSLGNFELMYNNMKTDIKRNKRMTWKYGNAPNMTKSEKKISFLNNYFVFKKIREVNVNNINLDLNEYENPDKDLTISQTIKKTDDNDNDNNNKNKNKNKIVKLNKTLKIVPAEGVKQNKTKKVKKIVLEK